MRELQISRNVATAVSWIPNNRCGSGQMGFLIRRYPYPNKRPAKVRPSVTRKIHIAILPLVADAKPASGTAE